MSTNPRVSVRAVIIQNGMILLSKYLDSRGYWYVIPGGGVENGETMEEAFRREMLEEVGMELPFGELLFIREIIADRHSETGLQPGFHQIELNVRSHVPQGAKLGSTLPDKDQIDLMWHPLEKLHEINFFPRGLVDQFKKQEWPKLYCGEMR